MNALLKLRPVDPDDEPFLRRLRAQVDTERLGLHAWSPEQAETARLLIDLQFRAHAAHYRKVKNNWDTKDCVIELDGVPVGRFVVTQDSKVVHLADLAVDFAHRGKGLGHAVIDTMKAECEQSRRVLRLCADRSSTVVQFYVQQGFLTVQEELTHWVLEWVPSSLTGKTAVFAPKGP